MTTETPEQRAADGRKAREIVPRSVHGEWSPPADRTDPLEILALQATTRVPDLVPIRYGRMAASPFAFYRGAAAVMAADLAHEPHSHLDVQLCGDAHLVNFGGFATPERDMIFDVNDFDETLPGPFEWDLKRLAASIEVAARSRGFDDALRRKLVALSSRATARRSGSSAACVSSTSGTCASTRRPCSAVGEGGHRVDPRGVPEADREGQDQGPPEGGGPPDRARDGKLRFKADPPLLTPIDELVEAGHEAETDREPARRPRRLPHDPERRPPAPAGPATPSPIWPARSSASGRWAPGAGWPCSSAGTTATRWSCRSRRPSTRWPSRSCSRVSTTTWASGWSRASASSRAPATSSSAGTGSRGSTESSGDFYFRQMWDWKLSPDVDTMKPEGLEHLRADVRLGPGPRPRPLG